MEPTKFEEYSREKFEERELKPSATAWDNLEKMLDTAAPTKKKSGFPWFAIAASFIGFLVIASIVFNKTRSTSSPDFVEETTPIELLETKEVLPQENKKLKLLEEQKERVANVNETTNSNQSNQEIVKQKEAATQYNASEKARIASTVNSNIIHTPPKKQQQKSGVVTFQKSKEVIAYNTPIKEEKSTPNISEKVTKTTSNEMIVSGKEVITTIATKMPTDVDALLEDAQRSLKENSDQKTQKIDAMALLGDIELNREQSLRTKVMYALGEGFEYVKSNVVELGN